MSVQAISQQNINTTNIEKNEQKLYNIGQKE